MMVQDRKTGKWYDPNKELKKLFDQQWFIDILKRMKAK